MKYTMIAISSLFLALATGCRMTPKEYEKWTEYINRENDEYQIQIRKLNEKNAEVKKLQKEVENKKGVLTQKNDILEKENNTLNDYWSEYQRKSHESSKDLLNMLNSSQKIFFNARFGNPATKREKTLVSEPNKYTIIMEMENKFKKTCRIQSMELYTSGKPGKTPAFISPFSETARTCQAISSSDPCPIPWKSSRALITSICPQSTWMRSKAITTG